MSKITLVEQLVDPAAPSAGRVTLFIKSGSLWYIDDSAVSGLIAGVPGSRSITAGAGLTGGGDLSLDRTIDIVAGDSSITVNANDIIVASLGISTAKIAANAVTDAKLRTSAALSVIARSANSTGDVADVSATPASGAVLRESGSTLGFGTIATAGITNDAVTFAKIQNSSAASKLLGRGSAAGAGDFEEITLGTNLSFSGTTLNAAGAALSDADYGDITVSGTGTVFTIDNDVVSDAKLRNSGALSVIGRSANTTGDPADISATAATDAVLRESGSVLGFGTVATGGIANNAITDAKLRTSAALSVVARSANTVGNVADISATAATDAVLRESGSTLGFGTIATGGISNNAVTDAKLRTSAALSLVGRSANTVGNVADISASAASDSVLRESGSTLGFGTIATGGISNNAITYAKMQDVSAVSKLVGRGSAGGSGDPEEITLGTGLSMSGTTLSVSTIGLTDSDYGDITVSGTGTVFTIDNDVVSDAKLRNSGALSVIGRSANSGGDPADISTSAASDAVLRESGGTLGFGTVATAGIADNAVTNAKLRQGAALSVVGRSSNALGNVADIVATAATDAVLRESGSTVGFGTIATGGIANDAVTYAKMQNVSAISKLLGRGSAGGSGDPEEITVGSGLSMSGTTLSAPTPAHSALSGLSADDHTQYSLVDGTRAFSAAVGGVTPTTSAHLATKGYVDGLVQGVEWQDSVIDRVTATPPGSPATNDRYIVAGSPTGAWVGHATHIATWNGSAWVFTVPTTGMITTIDAESITARWNGSAWADISTIIDHGTLIGLGDDDHTQYHNDTRGDLRYPPLARTVTAGNGLTGGGDLSANRTLDVAAGDSSITVNANDIIVATGGITTAKLAAGAADNTIIRDSGALSVIGRSANSGGDPADISATPASGAVLRESGSTLGFGTIATAGITDAAVTFAKIQDSSAASKLLGRGSAAGAGDFEEITLGTNLSFSGTTLNAAGGALSDADYGDITVSGTGTVMTIDNDVVSDAKLRNSGALSVIGRSANTTGDPADISATAATDAVLRESGSTIGFGTIATGGIANDAVTYAKMQNVSAISKLLGRGSAGGSGDPEEITLGTNLSMSGTTLNATGGGALSDADYGDITVSGTGTVMTIDNSVVTNAKLRDSTALTVVGRSANSTGAVADIAATPASGAVLRESGSTVGFGAVATAGIADDAITYAKMQNVSAASKLLGRGGAGGSGDPEEITLGTGLTLTGTTLSNAIGGVSSSTKRRWFEDRVYNLLGSGVTDFFFEDFLMTEDTPTNSTAGGSAYTTLETHSCIKHVTTADAGDSIGRALSTSTSGNLQPAVPGGSAAEWYIGFDMKIDFTNLGTDVWAGLFCSPSYFWVGAIGSQHATYWCAYLDGGTNQLDTNITITANVWHRIELVRRSTMTYMYVDGVLGGSANVYAATDCPLGTVLTNTGSALARTMLFDDICVATKNTTSFASDSINSLGINTGSATVDFGATPGSSDTSVVVTGQLGVASTSKIKAWVRAEATGDHTIEEVVAEPIRVIAGNISVGSSFTIYALCDYGLTTGEFTIDWEWY